MGEPGHMPQSIKHDTLGPMSVLIMQEGLVVAGNLCILKKTFVEQGSILQFRLVWYPVGKYEVALQWPENSGSFGRAWRKCGHLPLSRLAQLLSFVGSIFLG